MHGILKYEAEMGCWHPMPSIAHFFLYAQQTSGITQCWVDIYTELKRRLTGEFKINATVVLL